MADAAISALFDGAQVTAKKKKPKSEAWYAAIRNRDFGFAKCKLCSKDFKRTNGKAIYCPECRPIYKKIWEEEHSEQLKERRKRDYWENKEIHSQKSRKWYEKNKEKAIRASAVSRARKMKEDPESVRAYSRELMRKRRINDVEKDRKYRREYVSNRRKTDPIFALNAKISQGMRRGLVGGKGGKHWEVIVGYTVHDLRDHLESLFLPGMTWGNHGRGKHCWHIDHKIPLSLFNYETENDIDFKRAWDLENLQPLWEVDNLKKGNKFKGSFQPSLALG